MAIKKLQNNFTTPEQSKRLQELGVPADSADCYWSRYGTRVPWSGITLIEGDATYTGITSPPCHFDFLPCWSVGRLMEIFEICDNLPSFTRADVCSIPSLKRMSYMEYMMKCYNKAIEMGILDFSKLEE